MNQISPKTRVFSLSVLTSWQRRSDPVSYHFHKYGNVKAGNRLLVACSMPLWLNALAINENLSLSKRKTYIQCDSLQYMTTDTLLYWYFNFIVLMYLSAEIFVGCQSVVNTAVQKWNPLEFWMKCRHLPLRRLESRSCHRVATLLCSIQFCRVSTQYQRVTDRQTYKSARACNVTITAL